ncbi:MAG: RHS repeat-associated core domain-containing protein [Salinivenus sp.]
MHGRYNQSSSPTKEDVTGHVKDNSANLHDAGARYYSGAFARWLGPDPILGEKGAKKLLKQDARLIVMSSYNYAFDNPTTLTDPIGLAPTDWAMLVPMHTDPQSRDLRRSIGPAPTHERTNPAAEAGPLTSQSKIQNGLYRIL